MVREEWKRLIRNPLLILVIAAIILIPSIYAGFFLASMWDPYGELDKLPVAVVNLDTGAEYNGKVLDIGNELVENLKEDGSLDFRFVDSTEAESGLRDGRYYMVVTIPEDFSYRASTVTDEDPEKMELLYETNPATNYVAMKLSESAMTKIEMSLQQKVSETYAEEMFKQFGTISDGMYDAADGAGQLLDGEERLADGAGQINDGAVALNSGAAELSTGTETLYNGAYDLNDGIHRYLDGAGNVGNGIRRLNSAMASLSSGATDLSSGASALANGTSDLNNGAQALVNGTASLSSGAGNLAQGTTSLSQGASSLASGASQLSTGLESINSNVPALVDGIGDLDAGASSLCDGLTAYTSGVNSAYTGASQVSSGLNDLCIATSNLAAGSSDINTSIIQINEFAQSMAATGDPYWTQLAQYTDSLVTGYGQLNDGITALNTNVPLLAAGAGQVTAGLGQLDSNSAALNEGASGLAQGASALNDAAPALAEGISSAAEGASSLSQGANALNSGAAALANGASEVAQGAQTISSGTSTLADGIDQVDRGAQSLADGTSTLNNGISEIRTGTTDLMNGSDTLTANNQTLADGASTLSAGAAALNNGAEDLLDGTRRLADGTSELVDSLPELSEGTSELQNGLTSGADEISSTSMNTTNAEMMADPVELEETRITEVADNGHAMAAYMMSVGLWVASLAFCLMYPLTKHDKLTGGFSWWLSKASVLYPMAILQAIILVLILHIRLGFDPARFAGTIAIACLASMAFMSLMYFFNVLLGKVGSFIMLVFMVLQLAGSAGTYPLEISGPLAQALNRFMPFTYTVNAFRSTIGGGEKCGSCIAVLLGILIISSILTILLFIIRGQEEQKGHKNLYDFMEERGFA
jgi:putative membrane protein